MKIIRGIKIGGLQQKIFDLMLVVIFLLVATYVTLMFFINKDLSNLVQKTNVEQQESITNISEQTMETVLSTAMTQTTALQAYIANDLFMGVRSDVLTLQTIAEGLLANSDLFQERKIDPPSAANDGKTSAQLVHEDGVDPDDSEMLGIVANLSDVMMAMYESSDNVSSIFIGTSDGNMVLVNDRPSTFVSADGTPLTLDIRHRPWYSQAAEAGELIFTGVEFDANTDIPMIECAAPVYLNGELAAVVSADIWLTSISDYVESKSSEGSFICVINERGQMVFSPDKEGSFKVVLSDDAPDLRKSENSALAAFVERALKDKIDLTLLEVDGKEVYMCGVPLEALGWTVVSVVEKELIHQPTEVMLANYDEINEGAVSAYEQGLSRGFRVVIILTVIIILLAVIAALVLASHVVKPIERMTSRINNLSGTDQVFEMEKVYRTGDEIEALAQSFASLTENVRDYITKITQITAEKERIGTELALATRIQADMLPNIFPAFPDRLDFDIYATMTPAKEVGGDFYDFFLIDETHLGMVMADVSGKGVPAALFMMVSKILVQNFAMTGRSPAEVLRSVNDQICANNREEMFVTVWFGILDTETGIVTAANAGHEYPAVRHTGGKFELLKDKHGFVIGGMEGVRYKEYELKLTPGSKLFLYTDGVPEATNAQNELFGTERMLDALNKDNDASPDVILNNVHEAVDCFVRNAEQFDDLTMLCLEYKGPERMS